MFMEYKLALKHVTVYCNSKSETCLWFGNSYMDFVRNKCETTYLGNKLLFVNKGNVNAETCLLLAVLNWLCLLLILLYPELLASLLFLMWWPVFGTGVEEFWMCNLCWGDPSWVDSKKIQELNFKSCNFLLPNLVCRCVITTQVLLCMSVICLSKELKCFKCPTWSAQQLVTSTLFRCC